jgi:hypothetical protein
MSNITGVRSYLKVMTVKHRALHGTPCLTQEPTLDTIYASFMNLRAFGMNMCVCLCLCAFGTMVILQFRRL